MMKARNGQKTILGVVLNPGISRANMIAFWLMTFAIWTCVNFIFSFITFILSDPDYYAVPQDQVAGIIGRIGCYAEIGALI